MNSLTGCSGIPWHVKVVFFLPWAHVFWKFLSKSTLAGLFQWVLVLESGLHLLVLVVVFLVLFEDFRVLSQILLVWSPGSINAIFIVVFVRQVEVYRAHVVVIYSVLDVLEIVMGNWHTQLKKLLVHSLLRVLELVS